MSKMYFMYLIAIVRKDIPDQTFAFCVKLDHILKEVVI